MPLQIFVEDRLNEAYEVLACKALGLPVDRRNRQQVRASIVDLDDLTHRDGLLDLVERSQAAGYGCIILIMDQEALPASADRPEKLRQFRDAFRQLCDYLDGLPERHPLKKVNVIRIVCQRCLEGWLAADPQAIVDAVRGVKGVRYSPNRQSTQDLSPHQAADRIAHIICHVGHELQNRDLLRASAGNVKRRGKAIATAMDLQRSRGYNLSLDYFCVMVDCATPGCHHPCPE